MLTSRPRHSSTRLSGILITSILHNECILNTKPLLIDLDTHINMASDRPDDGHSEHQGSLGRFHDGRSGTIERHEGAEQCQEAVRRLQGSSAFLVRWGLRLEIGG